VKRLPFFRKSPLKDLDSVKKEVDRIIAKQKSNSPYDLSSYKITIEELLNSISGFNTDWNKLPVVFRIARIAKISSDHKFDFGGNKKKNSLGVNTYQENIVLPDTKHNLELVIKMLNHMREQKKLKSAVMPLFIHPDEIVLAHREGKIPLLGGDIEAQLAIIFQKGSIMHIGFVHGRDYVILDN
jgi:hypothetical protein